MRLYYYSSGSRQTILNTKPQSNKTPISAFLSPPIQTSWKALLLNVSISGRWDMGTSPSIFSSKFFTFTHLDFNFIVFSPFVLWVFHFDWFTGASITGEDAGFVLLVAMKFTHAVIVITKQRYFFFVFVKFSFVFILKILSFWFFLIWVCVISFIIRARWKTLLIATNSFVRMLNK